MFKPGDKLVCIDVTMKNGQKTPLIINKEYACDGMYSPNGGVKVKEYPQYAFFPSRFKLADPPITELILKGLL